MEALVGDRLGDLGALEGRSWDAVIDTSAYTPDAARRSTDLLRKAAYHYTFISTVSVYRDFIQSGMNEDAPVGTITDKDAAAAEATARSEASTTGASYGQMYGPLKARCEEVVKEFFLNRSLVVRPGLVVGPYDYSDRFTYWVRRIGLAGKGQSYDVLAPGRPDRRVQFIDARDLARWTVQATVDGVAGTFNSTGPDYLLSFGTFLETCRRTLGEDAELVWVDDSFLLERGLGAADLMPWHPVEGMPGWEEFFSIDASKAVANGLSFRPLAETIQDTFAWDQTREGDAPLKAGLTAAREAALLAEWRTFKGR